MTTKILTEIRDLLVDIKSLLTDQRLPEKSGGSPLPTHPGNATVEHLDWAEYFDQKKPQSDYEIITLVVDHLIRTGQEQTITKDKIINFLWENPQGIKNPKRIGPSINHTASNSSYEYIEFNKKNKAYRLSIKGKQLIYQLPNRPPSKKKAKRRGKKK